MAEASGVDPPRAGLSSHLAARKYQFDHYIPGLTIIIGVIGVAVGAVLPWIEATGPKLNIPIEIFSTELQWQQSLGGLDKGAGDLLALIVVPDVIALLVAVALMARHRRRGLVLRLAALLCAVSTGALGVYLLTLPDQYDRGHSLYHIASSVGLASIKPGPGAFLVVFGSLVVLIGAIMPGRRKRLEAA